MKNIPASLQIRTKAYALRIIRLYSTLKKRNDDVCRVIGRQVLRSGTSIGAQHREAYRARSNAEFISKMESALQELDETSYWIELLIESKTVKAVRLSNLMDETEQLIAIFVSSIKTAKKNKE